MYQHFKVHTPNGHSRGYYTLIQFESPPPGPQGDTVKIPENLNVYPRPRLGRVQTKYIKLKQQLLKNKRIRFREYLTPQHWSRAITMVRESI